MKLTEEKQWSAESEQKRVSIESDLLSLHKLAVSIQQTLWHNNTHTTPAPDTHRATH